MAPVESIQGDYPLDEAIVEALPKGTKVLSAESWGLSAWSRTAKISTILSDGTSKKYFVKCADGDVAKSELWSEHYSASLMASFAPEFGPNPVGKGLYQNEDGTMTYFYVQNFHDMDLETPPDPAELASTMAALHRKSHSPNGNKFGYPIVAGRGTLDRVEHWSESWAVQFTHYLKDLVKLDTELNGQWPEFDAALKQLIERVIPRLLGALQSEGRSIKPSLVHGNLWEGNVATDMETGKVIAFDFDECMFAHNEAELATWRCRWATNFQSPVYIQAYQQEIEPSEPVEEFDDRIRLYSIKNAVCDSAGHRGSVSRQTAYNDMLFLCEKYAPLEGLEKYDPMKDISVTGIQGVYDRMADRNIRD
ncbi:Fructosamine kinase-domain-containing protein [Xylaria arbuscula]|nr:Fructosamine kinase-domain-containing protein [Xylaria arbuscula]